MPRVLTDNGLTNVLMLLFAGSVVGHWIAGWKVENEELMRHGADALSLTAYLADPAFYRACSKIGKANSCRCRLTSC